MLVEVGKIVEGKVSGITSFGAFVQLPEGKTGLVHISEIAEHYVKDIKDYLKESQVIQVKVLSMEPNGKISLSIKKAQEAKPKNSSFRPEEIDWSKGNTENMSFEDRLSRFMKDSEDRLHDLKKNFESKRGGGSYRRSAQTY